MPGQVRSIAVRFLAEVGNYVQGVGRMKAATGDLVTELSKSEQQRQNFQRLGTTMLVAGAGIAAGIGLATKAAVDWESAWAGVAKTVDGTEAELAALEEDLRGLARELPATHGEIAAVAEAAGQLGVATEDITDFTRTMIDLGEATNLTADEAATSIAQLMNVMGTAPDQVDELASALVELGNNGASTEREIVMMAQRIAGAGSIVGATEADVLALANALASAGIEVQAGGSAISRVMVDIATAVNDGGEKMETFAAVAGVSSDEFARHWQSDPVAALNLFVQGLGRMNEAGGNVFGTLEQLGLSEIRTRDALLRLSSAGDLLTNSLDDGARAWNENTALLVEVERRYGTVEARLQIARNQINDFAIDIGQTFLPVLGDAADTVGAFVEMVGELPGPLKTALGILAAITAGVLLFGGTLFTVIPRIAATKAALDQLTLSGGRAAAAVGVLRTATSGVTSFLGGPWGIALGVAAVAVTAFAMSQAQARARAQEFTDTLDRQTGALTDDTRALIAHKLEEKGALEIAQQHGIELSTLVDAVEGSVSARRELSRAVAENAEITEVHGQGITKETGAIVDMDEVVRELTGDLDNGTAAWAREAEAVGGAAEAHAELEPATRDLAAAFDVSAQSAEDVADAVDALDKELEQLFERVFGLQNAQDDLADAFDALTEQINEQRDASVAGAGSFEGMSEAARDNRDAAQELLEKLGALAIETAEQTGSAKEAQGVLDDFEAAMRDLEEQTGANISEMDGYNDTVSEIERLIEVFFKTPGAVDAATKAQHLADAIGNIPRNVVINYSTSPVGPIFGPAIPRRHGGITEDGVIRAQHGVLRHPSIFTPRSPARFAFAEPATGGEAFIPRFGDRDRSLAIADHAARWHGGRVVDGTGLGGRWQWRGRPSMGEAGGGTVIERQEVNVSAYSDTFSLQQVMDDLAFRGVA